MLGLRRIWVVTVALVGCGGAPAPAPEHARPAVTPKADPVVESADLSPVAAPAGLFVVGRLKRPTHLAETVAKWAGVPVGLRDLLPMSAKDLDAALLWDAPVELAVAVSPSGRRAPVETGVSIGITSVEAALGVARQQGYEIKKLGPDTYALSGARHVSCAIAPSLGPASARLVCSRRAAELEDLLPYMTRGLPTEALGQRDLELEVRLEPIRQRFGTELGSARLFAGFAVRELQLDSPRFDRALSDTAYALADETVAFVRDLDLIRVSGSVDEQKRVIDAELTATFGGDKSFIAGVTRDNAKHSGPAPEKFFLLPADADAGGYSNGFEPRQFERIATGLAELTDAYLEQQKLGKPTRERVGRLITAYLGLDGAAVQARGSASLVPATKAKDSPAASGWMLLRVENATPVQKGFVSDLAAVLADKDVRALLAKRLRTSEKELPSGRLVPLRGPGIPAGTQALTIKVPTALGPLFGRAMRLGNNVQEAAPPPLEQAIAVVPSGSDAFFASAGDVKELAARVSQALSGKGATLATRPELAPMRTFNATSAMFSTLSSIVNGTFDQSVPGLSEVLAGQPNHGKVPVFGTWSVAPSKPVVGTLHVTVPAGVFEDLPGLVPVLAASFMKVTASP